MKTAKLAIAIILLISASIAVAQPPTSGSEWTTIVNGRLWQTDEGKTVQAHAPGFVHRDGLWYMVGEDRSGSWHPDVNLYASTDLVHWKFVKKIIENGVTDSRLGRERMIERAKLLYCERTGKFVVWCHWESLDYSASEAACFSSDAVDGDYRLEWCGRPLGIKSRDCNVFVDNDGTAYFISTTNENQDLGLFRLSDDYLSVVEHTRLFPGQRREAPAIVRIGQRYFMFSSACTGWAPNQCKLSYSTDLRKGWSPLEDIGDKTAYRTQAAAILEVRGTKQTTYLYVGDRWMDPDLPRSKTIMFPIAFEGTRCQFDYHERFDINFQTGEWREGRRQRSRGEAFQTEEPMVHDPVMAREGDTYYIFSTGRGIQQMASRDRKTWTMLPQPLMSVIPGWTTDSVAGFTNHVWAPDILNWHGRWWLTYSCSTFGKNTSAIGLLSSRSLRAGLWKDEGCIVASKEKRDNWNAIDPNIVIDPSTDTPWMVWGSFWDGIQLVRLDSTMHIAAGEQPRTIARRHRPGDPNAAENPTSKFAGRNAIEAPFIFRHGDYYYLFVSWDYCCRGAKSNYRVAVGRSHSVEGPYLDADGRDMLLGGGTIVLEGDKQEFEAAGHCAAYTFDGEDVFICHGYSVAHNGMAILVQRPIRWSPEGWPIL